MKKNAFFLAALRLPALAVLVLFAGCATKHTVKVSSIDRSAAATRPIASYRIGTRTQVTQQDTLRFKEAAQHVRTALSARGLYEAPSADSADLLVEIDYGMDAPRVKVEQYQVPVFGRGPADSRADSVMLPEKELMGYQEVGHVKTVREKHLSICGRENRPATEGRPPEELWRVDVSIENESKDMREYLPLLASAAMDQIGRNTDGPVTMSLSGEDDAVEFVKKGL